MATKTKTKRPMLKKYAVTVDGATKTVFDELGSYHFTCALPREIGQPVSYSVRIERLLYTDNDIGLHAPIGRQQNAAIPPSMRCLDPFGEVDFAVGHR